MIITKEVDYAVRILRELGDGQSHTEKSICREEEIPVHFCYRIARKLADAKMVEITRGRNGGYTLSCDLHTTSVMDVIDTIKEEPVISGCMREGDNCRCRQKNNGVCLVHCNLQKLQKQLIEELKEINLYSLIFE